MRGGTLMLCADGKKRLCFPILCQYISDMEEQWLLTNQVKPACPKCPKRTRRLYGSPNENPQAPPGNGKFVARSGQGSQAAHIVRNGRVAKRQGASAASRRRVADGGKRGIDGGQQPGAAGGSEGANGGDGGDESQSESDSEFDAESDLDAPQPTVSTAKTGTSKLPPFDSAEAIAAQQAGRKRITEKRTDAEAEGWRDGLDRGVYTSEQLRHAGYHPQ